MNKHFIFILLVTFILYSLLNKNKDKEPFIGHIIRPYVRKCRNIYDIYYRPDLVFLFLRRNLGI